MTLLATFTVYGNPRPKERPKHGKYNTYTPAETVKAERAVVDAFRRAYPLWEPSIEDLRLEATFYRKTRHAVDGDNLFKLVSDALNKVAYVDDRQLSEGEYRRVYGCGDQARTEVSLYLAEAS